jgi:hypothetical protein
MLGVAGANDVLAAVAPSLAPGETVRACLASAQTGPSPLFFLTSRLLAERFALVVTDRQLLALERGFVTGRVKQVLAVVPLAEVVIERWQPAKLWSTLRLRLGDDRLRLHVRPEQREDAEHLAFMLLASSFGSNRERVGA